MSKASEGEGASRIADYFNNRRLELVQPVDDLPDRIILGEEFRSGACGGDEGDQDSGDEQKTPSHCFLFCCDEEHLIAISAEWEDTIIAKMGDVIFYREWGPVARVSPIVAVDGYVGPRLLDVWLWLDEAIVFDEGDIF